MGGLGRPRAVADRGRGPGPAADLGEVDRLGLSDHAARNLIGAAPDDAPDTLGSVVF